MPTAFKTNVHLLGMWHAWVRLEAAAVGAEEPRQVGCPVLSITAKVVDARAAEIAEEQ